MMRKDLLGALYDCRGQQVKPKSGYKANDCGSNSGDSRNVALDSPNHIQKENA